MVEPKTPDGFKVVAYPNLGSGEDDALYICTKCRPQWDTFDEKVAKAHASTGLHNPELLRPA